jgi:hypothetical protein
VETGLCLGGVGDVVCALLHPRVRVRDDAVEDGL